MAKTWGEKLINFSGYNYEGEPRPNKKGVEVGFLIKKRIIYKTRHDINKETVSDLEQYYIEVKGDQHKVIAGMLYRPPNTSIDSFLEEYKNIISFLQ